MTRTPHRRAALLGLPLALTGLLTTAAAGGCGSNSAGSSGGNGGAGKGALQCQFSTFLEAPVRKQLVATSSVSCDFPVVTSKTTLVIQGRRTGAGNTAWDNFGDPKSTTTPPPNQLSYTVICTGGLDYQASADITGTGPNGQAFHSHETTDTVSYTQADCDAS